MTADLNSSHDCGNNEVSSAHHKEGFVFTANVVCLSDVSCAFRNPNSQETRLPNAPTASAFHNWADNMWVFLCVYTYLVVLRRRGHEEYRGYPVEALKPLLPLGPLPSNIHHLKGNLFDDKVVLDNPFSRLPRKQNVLLAGNIALKKDMRTLSCKVKSTECASDLPSHYDSPVVQYDPSYPRSIWPTHSADEKERIHYSRDTDLSHLIRIKET